VKMLMKKWKKVKKRKFSKKFNKNLKLVNFYGFLN